jgi:hypothetical protein
MRHTCQVTLDADANDEWMTMRSEKALEEDADL